MRADAQTLLLGIECGGTHTVALCTDAKLRCVKRLETGPANLRLLSDAGLLRHFRSIAKKMPTPSRLCIGMAGARNATDRGRIVAAANKAWPGVPCHPTSDLETALMAASDSPGKQHVSILILSGTGSCCFGRRSDGRTAKIGGWGHILGDKGSGFEIGLRALKAVVYYYDRDGEWPLLGARILRALQQNQPDDLIGWVLKATKAEIANVAVEVFKAAEKKDAIARDILKGAAHSLAADGIACARRLGGKSARFVLAGGVLIKQMAFRRQVEAELKAVMPGSSIVTLTRESVWGAVMLASQQGSLKQEGVRIGVKREGEASTSPAPNGAQPNISLNALRKSPTEQRNPRSMRLDKLSISEGVRLMLAEDAHISEALLRERKAIGKGVELIAQALRGGGRLFYVGAGTSGRLGVLDASECPPTFQTDPEMVQGIIAGGQRALWEAVEGAEDDPQQGAEAMRFRGVKRGDVVVGIAASGRTPFVRGALSEARARAAKTVLLCFNPALEMAPGQHPDLIIAPNVGPEILTGSTRLKAGTATKLVLNIFTTLAMVRLGKVLENLMVDVKASNEKLRDRAVRIVQELTKSDYDSARKALEKSRWQIRAARSWLGRQRTLTKSL